MVPIFNDGVWKLEALSDSDFANDKDTRYSVYGYIIYFCGVPVAWKSKSMKSVVLSTTEAEYVAVSEVVKEIKFLYQMLRSMEIKVPLPIKAHCPFIRDLSRKNVCLRRWGSLGFHSVPGCSKTHFSFIIFRIL